jgi:hypothetical protein
MSDSATSLRRAFELPDAGAADANPDRWQKLRERLDQEGGSIKWKASLPSLAPKVCELVDIQIPDVLLTVWKRADAVRAALNESRQTPEKKFEVVLSDHSVKSNHRPHVDVRLRGETVKTLQFSLELKFTVKGGVLEIRNGEINALQMSSCEFTGTFKYNELTLLEKKGVPLPLTRRIPLAPAASAPATR